MKKQLLLALCALISIVSYGQVRIMDNTPVQKEDTIVPYDSLSNFQLMYHGEHYDYCHLKGQTMIYCGIPYRGYPKSRFKVGDAFYIKDIIHTEPSLSGTFVLQHTKTKAIYKEDLGTVANKCWVINGHLAKIQQLCVGKDFLFKGVKNDQDVNGLISAKDHKPLTDVLYRSVWKCVDVQVKPRHADDGLLMDDRSPVVLVMENQQYGKVYCYYECDGGPFGRHAILSEDAMFETQDEFTRRMIKKYGEERGSQLASSNLVDAVQVGMSQQMLLDAWGEPQQRRRFDVNFKSFTKYVYPFADVVVSSSRYITEIIIK